MKLLTIALVALSATASGQPTDSWLNPFPGNFLGEVPANISGEQYFEVAASKETTAEAELAAQSSSAQNWDGIDLYGSRSFRCAEPLRPYLVRAIYANGGTGRFSLKTYGSRLVVFHHSLGANSGLHRTALIVCLATAPTGVFHSVGGAL